MKFNKRGQVTIFIIIAIIIIGSIGAFLIIKSKTTQEKQNYKSSDNPQEYIAKCTENALRNKIPRILEQGGYNDPKLRAQYNGTNIAFLCFTTLTYSPCINQEPLYIQHLNNEIEESIKEEVEECFTSLKRDYDGKKSLVNYEETKNLDVELRDRKVMLSINKKVLVTNNQETKDYEEFKASINSPAYNLARVGMEIVAGEAVFCYWEYLGYQTIYPWVRITKKEINSDVKIYTIIDRETLIKLNIAIKSCSIPAGL